MNEIAYQLSQSIKEGKWLSLTYNNSDKTTYFWVAIVSIADIKLKKFGVKIYNYNKEERFIDDGYIYFNKITSAQVLEGTSYEVPVDLIYSIEKNIKELAWLNYDQNHYNILSYLKECAKYDKEPYQRSYALVEGIDDEVLSKSGKYKLSLTQVDQMVKQIKNQTKRNLSNKISIIHIISVI